MNYNHAGMGPDLNCASIPKQLRQLAAALGITPERLSLIESGRIPITPATADRIISVIKNSSLYLKAKGNGQEDALAESPCYLSTPAPLP